MLKQKITEEESVNKKIDLSNFEGSLKSLLEENRVTQKLIFQIDGVQENHFILRYKDHHQILAIHPLLINSKEIDASMGFVKISHMDELSIAGKIFRFLSADGDDSDLESTQS